MYEYYEVQHNSNRCASLIIVPVQQQVRFAYLLLILQSVVPSWRGNTGYTSCSWAQVQTPLVTGDKGTTTTTTTTSACYLSALTKRTIKMASCKMSPSQFLQFGSWVMTWLGNGGFVLPRTLQDSEATMVLGRALSVQLSINCKRPRLPRQKSTSPTLFTFSLPSIGFVFITRKSRWPAFFVQTTMARHPGRGPTQLTAGNCN